MPSHPETVLNSVMWNAGGEGDSLKADLYIICDSLIAEKGAFSRHTAVWRGSVLFSARRGGPGRESSPEIAGIDLQSISNYKENL